MQRFIKYSTEPEPPGPKKELCPNCLQDLTPQENPAESNTATWKQAGSFHIPFGLEVETFVCIQHTSTKQAQEKQLK